MALEIENCDNLLAAMVGFDTVNHNISGRTAPEAPLAEFIESYARGMGAATHRFDVASGGFNLLVTHEARLDAPWLMFESHLDTVSVEGMTIDPFSGEIHDGRLWGRGACDTKGTAAAMLWALRRYIAGEHQPNNIAIAFVVDEEIGKTGAAALAEQHLPTLAWKPAGVIVGEPTELNLVSAHNGVVRWTIRTRGVAAHSADTSQGRSAISMMIRVIDLIETRYVPSLEASHPLTGKAQCSVNIIQGGVQVNIIPESCEIRIDRRVVPGEDPRSVLPSVEALLDDLRLSIPGMDVQQGDAFIDPPLDPAGGESFVGFIQDALRDMNLPSDARGVAYATDASNYSRVGLPSVIIGPGNIAQAHTKDEWIELDQLHRGIDVYLNIMRRAM